MRATRITTTVIFLLTILSLRAAAFVPRAEAEPAEREKVIIVLDASGSMWGQIDNEPKIAIAKSVVKDLVSDWNQEVDVGLTVYGHRRKADCADIEMLVSPGPLERERFVKAVEQLNPKGKTPLTAAVLKAAETLKYTESRATVVLVSDGVETCDLDPCAVSQDMESKGLDFTAHVIGFDVSKDEDVKKLRCVADNTGGKFLPATNAESLKSSLAEAVKEVVKVSTAVDLVAVNEEGGKPLQDVVWRITKGGERVTAGGGASPRYELEPGTYKAIATSSSGEATVEKEFQIAEGEQLKLEVLLATEGKLELVAVNKEGETPLDNVGWEVFAPPATTGAAPEKIRYGQGATPIYTLLPGVYQAKVFSRDTEQTASVEVDVKAGEQSRYEVVLAKKGILELVAVNTPGGEPLENVSWNVFDKAPNAGGKRENLRYGRGATPEYTMLPGTYYAEVSSVKGKAKAAAEVSVVAGEKKRFEVVLAKEGILELVAVTEAGGEPLEQVKFSVYTKPTGIGEKPENIAYGGGNTPSYTLLPGVYEVRASSVGGQAESVVDAEVRAGEKNRVEVIITQEGLAVLKAVTEAGGEPREAVAWTILSVESDPTKKPETVTYGGGDVPEYKLVPGKYLARVKSRKGKFNVEQEIEVLAGKRTEIEVLVPKEGIVVLKPVNQQGGEPVEGVRWTVYDIPSDIFKKAETVTYGGGNVPEYVLLPGKYKVVGKVTNGVAEVEQEIEVEGGKRSEIEVLFPQEGLLSLETVKEGTTESAGNAFWEVLTIESDPLRSPKVLTQRSGPTPEFRLLPGKYTIRVSPKGLSKTEQVVEVKAGEKTAVQITVN